MEEKESKGNEREVEKEILETLENNTEKEDILDLIYKAREEKIDDIIKNINKKIKEEYKNLNDEEEKENIKVGKYIEEIYKQGLKDGVNLFWSIGDRFHLTIFGQSGTGLNGDI